MISNNTITVVCIKSFQVNDGVDTHSFEKNKTYNCELVVKSLTYYCLINFNRVRILSGINYGFVFNLKQGEIENFEDYA